MHFIKQPLLYQELKLLSPDYDKVLTTNNHTDDHRMPCRHMPLLVHF